MKKTRLKPVSDKQKRINAEWKRITDEKAEELGYTCQWCGKGGQRVMPEFPFTYLDGHHVIKRRFNVHTKEVCYICHRVPCHSEIEDNNVDVSKYPNKKEWEALTHNGN